MFDTIYQLSLRIINQFDMYALLIGVILLFIAYLLFGANRVGKLDWTDLITSKNSNKVSLTKLLQLIGGITATWIMIYITMHSALTPELFLTYLVYVGAIDGWSKFVAAKYGFSTNQSTQQ